FDFQRRCPPPQMYGRVWIRFAAAIANLTAFGAFEGGTAVPSGSSVATPGVPVVVVGGVPTGEPGGPEPPVSVCADAPAAPSATAITVPSNASPSFRAESLTVTHSALTSRATQVKRILRL